MLEPGCSEHVDLADRLLGEIDWRYCEPEVASESPSAALLVITLMSWLGCAR